MSRKTTPTNPKSRSAQDLGGGSKISLRGSGHGKGSPPEIVSMSSTEARNGFGQLLETVALGGTVFIERRNTATAVVMSVERYHELTRETEPDPDELTAEFDVLLELMQSPHARAGLRTGFRATPDELAETAVAAAREDRQ